MVQCGALYSGCCKFLPFEQNGIQQPFLLCFLRSRCTDLINISVFFHCRDSRVLFKGSNEILYFRGVDKKILVGCDSVVGLALGILDSNTKKKRKEKKMSNKRQPFKLFQTFRSSVCICQGAEAGETSSSLELNKTKIF